MDFHLVTYENGETDHNGNWRQWNVTLNLGQNFAYIIYIHYVILSTAHFSSKELLILLGNLYSGDETASLKIKGVGEGDIFSV